MSTNVRTPAAIPTVAPSLPQPGAGGKTVEQRLAAIEQRLDVLEKLLNPKADGSATIRAGRLAIEVASFLVRASVTADVVSAQTLTIKSQGTATLQAGAQLAIKGQGAVSLQAGTQLDVQAGGTAAVRGAPLVLNGGTRPLARAGDAVQTPGAMQSGQPIPAGQIAAGSPTILA